jgi:hypothetical protein
MFSENEGERRKRLEEPATKTSNLLNKLRTGPVGKPEKTNKRADSGDEKAEWSGVGSGLIMITKSNNRESEPPQTLKQSLDFQHIFGDNTTVDAKKQDGF